MHLHLWNHFFNLIFFPLKTPSISRQTQLILSLYLYRTLNFPTLSPSPYTLLPLLPSIFPTDQNHAAKLRALHCRRSCSPRHRRRRRSVQVLQLECYVRRYLSSRSPSTGSSIISLSIYLRFSCSNSSIIALWSGSRS